MNQSTIDFLMHLDPSPEATFNIEHYTDLPKGMIKPKQDELIGRYANLTRLEVEALMPNLVMMNTQGAGIFVAVNQCSGQRQEKNVSRIRGIHADMDDITDDQLTTVTAILQPSIVVQSSEPNRYQLYWLLADGETLGNAETKAINQCLAKHHGADKAAVDVSRLLRLPGFKHMKYRAEGKTPAVTATYYGHTYAADQIRCAFPPSQITSAASLTSFNVQKNVAVTTVLTPQLNAVATSIAAVYPQLWAGDWANAVRRSGEIGYKSQSEADLALAGHITRACQRSGIDAYSLGVSVEAVMNSSPLGHSDKWQNRHDYRSRTIGRALSNSHPLNAENTDCDLVLESHGDIRNANAFAQCAGGRFLYVATRGRWLQWHKGKWSICEKDEHIAMAKEVCGQMLINASNIFQQDQEKGKRYLQDAIGSHNLPRIVAMLKLTVSEPDMATTDRELDCDPYLLGVTNGVVDLRSGRHLANQPSLQITRYCNAGFDIDAICPQWLRFLNEIFSQDAQTIACVQRLLGCTLLGLSKEEILIICYGFGSNGKSVFSNLIHKIMGGYSITAPPSLLTTRRQDDTGPRNDLAALAGARYVSINEMQAGDRLDEQVVKMLAGREPISARFLHQEFFEFTPTFTPWLRTNHKPIIHGVEEGIWRRLVLLKFGVHITDDKKDPLLEQKLLAERDGILMWMIEGARLYQGEGICMSPSMRNELKAYRSDSDLLGEFLSDTTSESATDKVVQNRLYTCYRDWSFVGGLRPMTKKSFTQRLVERGYKESKSGSNRFYAGLKLIDETVSSQTVDRVDWIQGNLDNSPF
jgi:putative DNA primase/helicase